MRRVVVRHLLIISKPVDRNTAVRHWLALPQGAHIWRLSLDCGHTTSATPGVPGVEKQTFYPCPRCDKPGLVLVEDAVLTDDLEGGVYGGSNWSVGVISRGGRRRRINGTGMLPAHLQEAVYSGAWVLI